MESVKVEEVELRGGKSLARKVGVGRALRAGRLEGGDIAWCVGWCVGWEEALIGSGTQGVVSHMMDGWMDGWMTF